MSETRNSKIIILKFDLNSNIDFLKYYDFFEKKNILKLFIKNLSIFYFEFDPDNKNHYF